MRIVANFSECEKIPNVSVIIPTYNRIPMLEEALASLFAQTYKGNVEVIVVDDNSQDGTPRVIKEKYPDIHLISLSENGGPSAARNKGILAAKGYYIAFLDSDDLWEPQYLKTQVSALEDNKENYPKSFCVSNICIWEVDRDIRYNRPQCPHPTFSSALHHLLSAGSFIHTPSAVVFPRHSFDEIGLFDEDLRFGEDTDLYIRFLLHGYQPIYTQNALSIRRKHDEQAVNFKNMNLRIKNRLNTARKYHPLTIEVNSSLQIQKIYAEIYADFASHYYHNRNYLQWLALSRCSMNYIPWWRALIRMKGDISSSVKRRLRLKTGS